MNRISSIFQSVNIFGVFIYLFSILIFSSCNVHPVENIEDDFEGLITIDNIELFVRKEGQGQLLLVIHGGPGLSQAYLAEHLSPLSREFQLLFYDQRSSGRSSIPIKSDSITFQKLVHDIKSIQDIFHIEKINILSHSWGSLLAINYAAQYPDKINKLIIVDGIAPSLDLNTKANTKLANLFSSLDLEHRVSIIRSDAFKNGKATAYEELMMIGFKYQFYDSKWANDLHLSLPENFAAKSQKLQDLANDLRSYDYTAKLSQIESPTLLIYGDTDPLALYAMPVYLQNISTVDTMQSILLKDCGHFPFIEKKEETLQSIRNFLKD